MKYKSAAVILGVVAYAAQASEPRRISHSSSPISHWRTDSQAFYRRKLERASQEVPPMLPLPKSTLHVLIGIFNNSYVTPEDVQAIKTCLPPDRDAVNQLQDEIGRVGQSINRVGTKSSLSTYHQDLKKLLEIVQERRSPKRRPSERR